MTRDAFAECLTGAGKPQDADDLCNFVKNQIYYPNDTELRKKYYEETNWQEFKKDIGKIYKNMQTTPQAPPPFQKTEFKNQYQKGVKGFSKY